MEKPLTGEERIDTPADRQSQTTRSATAHTDMDEAAKDADLMLRTIVGSISADPDEIKRRLNEKQSPLSPAPTNDVNIPLVILAVALTALLFTLDLVFLKM